MGTKISLDDPEYGDDCEPCYDPGKTPKYVYVWFWDVKKGDKPGALQPPNLHLFKLTQVEFVPCNWRYWNPATGWQVLLEDAPGNQWNLSLTDGLGEHYFFGFLVKCPEEHDVYDNALDAPEGNLGYGGHGIIQWLTTAVGLISSFVLPTDSDILFEFFTTDTGQPVYKFCFPKYGMNIKFLVTP